MLGLCQHFVGRGLLGEHELKHASHELGLYLQLGRAGAIGIVDVVEGLGRREIRARLFSRAQAVEEVGEVDDPVPLTVLLA